MKLTSQQKWMPNKQKNELIPEDKPKLNAIDQVPANNSKRNNLTAPPKTIATPTNQYESQEIELGIVGSLSQINGTNGQQDCKGNIDVSLQDTRD